jgi:hypothetical protein
MEVSIGIAALFFLAWSIGWEVGKELKKIREQKNKKEKQ